MADTGVYKVESKLLMWVLGGVCAVSVAVAGLLITERTDRIQRDEAIQRADEDKLADVWKEINKIDKLVYFIGLKNGMSPNELYSGANTGPTAEMPLAQVPMKEPSPTATSASGLAADP